MTTHIDSFTRRCGVTLSLSFCSFMICLDRFLKRLSHTHLHEFNLASMQNISGWFGEVSCVNSPEQTIVDKGLKPEPKARTMMLSILWTMLCNIYTVYMNIYVVLYPYFPFQSLTRNHNFTNYKKWHSVDMTCTVALHHSETVQMLELSDICFLDLHVFVCQPRHKCSCFSSIHQCHTNE